MDTKHSRSTLPDMKTGNPDIEFICREARSQFKVNLAYFTEVSDGKQLQVIGYSGENVPHFGTYVENFIELVEGWVYESQAPLLIPDTSQDPRFLTTGVFDMAPCSILSVPVNAGERFAGVLSLHRPAENCFTPEMINKIHYFSRMAGKLLERNIQQRHGELLEKKLNTLSTIQRTITSIIDREKLATFIREILLTNLRLDDCKIALFSHRQEIERLPKDIQRVISRKNPAIIDNPDGQPVAVAPIVFQRRVLGYLIMQDSDIREYLDLAEILSVIIGTAVQRLDISREYESKGREYEALEAVANYEMSGIFTSAADLSQILDSTLEIIVNLLKVERVNIMLLDPETNLLKVQAYWGVDEKPFGIDTLKMGEGIAGTALHTGRPYQKQMNGDGVFIGSPAGQDEIQSLLAFPMLVEKRKIGVINIGSIYSDRVFNETELRLISIIASRTALAIENNRLSKESRSLTREVVDRTMELNKKTKELQERSQLLSVTSQQLKESLKTLGRFSGWQSLIHSFSSDIICCTDPGKVARLCLECLKNILPQPMTIIAVTLLDEALGRFRVQEAMGPVSQYRRLLELNPAFFPEEISTLLLKDHEPLLAPNVETEPLLADLKVLKGLQSLYAFPMPNDEQTFGLVVIGNSKEKALSEEEIETVSLVTNLTSASLNSVRSRTDLQVNTEKQMLLNRIAPEVDAASDSQRWFERLVELSCQLVEHDFGVLLLYDQWGKLRWKASHSSKKSFAQYLTRAHIKEMLDEVVDRNVIYHSSADHDRFIKRYSLLKNLGVKSMVILPLKLKDHKIGAILLGDERQKYHPRHMLDFYKIMAARLALIINNVLLFSDILLEKNRIESIIQCMNEGVISVDWERKIVDFNKAAEDLTGWKEEEVLGKSCYSIFACRQAPVGRSCADVCPLLEILIAEGEDKKGIRTEGKFLMRDGKERDLSIMSSLLTAGEDPVGGVLVFRDITEEKKFQNRRSDYLAAISHDIFTPLTAIKGYATTLLMHQERFDAKTQQNFIKVINSEIDRVTRLLYNLMSLSRMETDRLQAVPQAQKLESHVERIVSLYSLSSRNHQIIMDDSVKNMPEVYADSDHLEQIMNNLVSNAVKYSPAGGDVTISARLVEDDAVEISVRDQGIGIDPKDLDRIFDKYQRVIKKDSRSVSGMGLGLFITKVLVELNNGKIRAENAPEGGTQFVFTMPKAAKPVQEQDDDDDLAIEFEVVRAKDIVSK